MRYQTHIHVAAAFIIAASLSVTAGAATPGAVSSQSTVNFDIPQQALTESLRVLGIQANINIVYDPPIVVGRLAPELKGPATAREALAALLKDTGLSYDFVTDKTVSIRTVKPADSNARKSQAGNSADLLRLAQEQTPAPAASESTAKPEGIRPGNQVEEIVVTAQKRVERLQDVPISVSVLSGEALDFETGESLNDVISTVPGVYSYDTVQGGGTKFSVRGVTSNTSLFSGSGTVGYYLDEVPFGLVRAPITPDANAYDMERVEVLRGPQGTLYGANSVNGVIRIITKDANLNDFQFKTRAQTSATQDGGENYRGDVALNVPLIPGRLALRTVLGYSDMSGWLDQTATGREDVNDAEIGTLRFKVNAQPNDDLSLEFLAWFNRDEQGGPSASPGNRTDADTGPDLITTDYDIFGLTATYDFQGFSLLSATNHMTYSNLNRGNFAPGLLFDTTIDSKVFSQEFRFASTGEGPLQWNLGAMYRDASDDIGGATNGTDSGSNNFGSESYALFGELKYEFADRLFDLTTGLRYFHDETSLQQLTNTAGVVPPSPITGDASFSRLTPRVVLTWHPTDDLNIYASYSQGFRSGFIQMPQVLTASPTAGPVDSDLLTNYEIGAKGGVFGGRLDYEVAVYHIDWQDTQQQLFLPIGPGGTPPFQAVPFNGQDISGDGIDISLRTQLAEGLNLSLTGSWNTLGFDGPVFATLVTGPVLVFNKGERPDESPAKTLGAALDYTTQLGSSGFDTRFSTSANYVTATTSHATGSALSRTGDSFLDIGATVSLIAPQNWTLTLFGTNLSDRDPVVRPVSAGARFESRIRPRTLGLQFDYHY